MEHCILVFRHHLALGYANVDEFEKGNGCQQQQYPVHNDYDPEGGDDRDALGH